MKKIFFFILLTWNISQHIFGQASFFDSYVYQSWNSFGSLSGTTSTDIMQTRDGYINIGTYEGFVRFDGIEFTTITKSESNDLSFCSARVLLEDSKDRLWVGSNDEGVQILTHDEKNFLYSTSNGLPNNSVRALMEDKKGNIWIGTAAGVVYITPKGHLITPQFESGTVSNGIIATAFYCDSAERVWLITGNERGLFLFSDGVFHTLPEFDKFGNYLATSIYQDKYGVYWVGLGEQGIVCASNGNAEKITTNTILDNFSTISIYSPNNEDIWFGTEQGIVVRANGSYHEHAETIAEKSHVNRIVSDREGNLWVATDKNGIGKFTHGKFKMKSLKFAVNSISEEPAGRIWAGTDNGLICYENDIEVQNRLTEYTKGIRIRDVRVTSDGGVLVSCYKKPGQLLYKNERITSWTTDNGLAGNKVRVAIESSPGEFYVGTTTGLSIIHADGSIKNFKQDTGLENEYVMDIFKDKNGIVWIGTDGNGIYLMKDEKIISHFTSKDGLSGNVIFKITQDTDGSYWICTGNGLTRCSELSAETGIPAKYESIASDLKNGSGSIFQAIRDNENNVWFASSRGICSCRYSELTEAFNGTNHGENLKSYSRDDGLASAGITSTAKSIVDKKGRIWFTMIDGIAIYDPAKIHENPVMPLVHIESVSVDNKVYKNTNRQIVLKPGTKRIEIKFTGLSFDAPERIKFTHKLTNFEKNFSEPSNARVLSYTNLKPGKHTFIVNAINGDGFYSENAEAMLLVQKPYIYQMPVFWILLSAAILGSIILFFYMKQQRMKLENLRLEKMVQQRTSELALEKEKSNKLLRAILPDKIADTLKGEIRSIGENFDEATVLFSDIVDFTKLSSGLSAEEIVGALNNLFCRFDDRAKNCGVEKIKTIGDSYMAACGIPSANKKHAEIMLNFAKGMLEDLEEYNKTAKIRFSIRIGLNSGPVTAGVIGKTKFIYDVWGNTVNVASRMEGIATPGVIRVSDSVYSQLKDSGIQFSEPIQENIKGKGLMTTYDVL